MIKAKRSHDATLLNAIVRHPDIYPWIGDDFAVPPTEFDVGPVLDQFVWMIPHEDGRPMGFCAFQPINRVLYSFHGGLFVECRGQRGRIAAWRMFEYMFDCLGVKKLMAMTPTVNRAAQRYNASLGMTREGKLTKAHQAGGKLVDLVIYGITVEEFEQCQSEQLSVPQQA